MIKLTILGIPQPKQSAKFRALKMGNKTFVKSYQPKSVVDNERNIAYDIKTQLNPDFKPFNCPIGIKALFVFPPLKSWSKKQLALLESGATIYKPTKPDLTDNLMKGLCDAMTGIVYIDDALICSVGGTDKIYGFVPRIEIEIYTL